MAWYADNSGQHTHAVGAKEPNAWGLYDMHGNVWEWCQDRYDKASYTGSPGTDPTGPATGAVRVGRGGSWNDPGTRCRSASRGDGAPSYRDGYLGFRLASTL